jgi:hypothetical protein
VDVTQVPRFKMPCPRSQRVTNSLWRVTESNQVVALHTLVGDSARHRLSVVVAKFPLSAFTAPPLFGPASLCSVCAASMASDQKQCITNSLRITDRMRALAVSNALHLQF